MEKGLWLPVCLRADTSIRKTVQGRSPGGDGEAAGLVTQTGRAQRSRGHSRPGERGRPGYKVPLSYNPGSLPEPLVTLKAVFNCVYPKGKVS